MVRGVTNERASPLYLPTLAAVLLYWIGMGWSGVKWSGADWFGWHGMIWDGMACAESHLQGRVKGWSQQ